MKAFVNRCTTACKNRRNKNDNSELLITDTENDVIPTSNDDKYFEFNHDNNKEDFETASPRYERSTIEFGYIDNNDKKFQ